MAIEKMNIFGLIGSIDDMDKALKVILTNGNTHMINALEFLNSSNYIMPESNENITILKEMSHLKSYHSRRDFSSDEKMVNKLMKIFDLKEEIRREYLYDDYDYDSFMKSLHEIYNKVNLDVEKIDKLNNEVDTLNSYITNLDYLKSYKLDLGILTNLKNFTFKLISLTWENFKKLEKNYENIPAIIYKLSESKDNVILYAIMSKTFDETVKRIFSSLNYIELNLPTNYNGSPIKVIEILEDKINSDKEKINEIKSSIRDVMVNHLNEIEASFTRLSAEKKIEEMKNDIAVGNNLYFLFGYVPASKIGSLKSEESEKLGNNIVTIIEDVKENMAIMKPPTHLKNNWLFKPFETLVKMYGIPMYNEKDPTPFFAITYMLLFGAMFGDVGQGLIGFLGGLLIQYKLKNSDFGGILERLGIISTIFGVLYGSVFGSENVIPALLLRPMLNINTVLLSAIVLGIVLITIGFAFGIYNSRKNKNIEEGVFGKNGLTGLVFYWDLLIMALCIVNGTYKYMTIQIIIMIICLILMLLKQPLSHLVKKSKKLYDEPVGDYYVEEGFGVIETIISMVSNTISFIRVGAFALNHVGLYIAFLTLANMMQSKVGGIFILILGNIIIIGLEGLIVFIQALRLEFYELFSKYLIGDGVEYEPIHLNFVKGNKTLKFRSEKVHLKKQAFSLL